MWVILSQKPIYKLIDELLQIRSRAETEKYIRQSDYLCCVKIKSKKQIGEIKKEIDAYTQCFNVPLFVIVAHNQWVYENPALCKLTYWEYISTIVEMTPDNFCELENIEQPVGKLMDADSIYSEITEKVAEHNFNRLPILKFQFERREADEM